MSKIFINYRRKDSAPYAGRVYDRLVGHFGDDYVFMDIDQIEPGEVFDQVILERLKAVQVAVILIGEHWLDIIDANGQRRLDHPDDWVRLEIATLLERNIRVIPVLVGGAAMLKSTQLPECLAPLTRRQALEITDHRFHTDVDKLIKALEKIMGVSARPRPVIPFATIFGAVAVAVVMAAFGLFHYSPWTVQEAGAQLSQPVVSELEKLVIEKSTVELPSETSPSSSQQLVIAEQPAVKKISKTRFPFEPEMVRILSGKFMMGSPETEPWRNSSESPQHEVTIAYAFEISKYEVTFDEYDAFAKATKRSLPDDSGWGRSKRPVINVSFNDAQAYVQWLSDKTGKQYRLPTEAEWEYAARAGTQTAYWWGNNLGKNNAVCTNCGSQWDNKQTAPVSSFKPNAFGLYDTAGNVREWMQDCWHENYQNAPNNGSAWMDVNGGLCGRRVVRGGSWDLIPQFLRSADRYRFNSDVAFDFLGFRIVRAF